MTYKTGINLLFILSFAITELANASIYVYSLPDGSKLITDKPQANYKLTKLYKTKPYRSKAHKLAPAIAIKSQYDRLIINTAKKYNLEAAFIKALIHTESAFDSNAISSAGAFGLMQLMPSTARQYNLNKDRFNPSRNIEAGTQHLKELMSRYNNNKTLSLAAYNAGQGAVRKHKGVPPYKETQAYIARVLSLYALYKKSGVIVQPSIVH